VTGFHFCSFSHIGASIGNARVFKSSILLVFCGEIKEHISMTGKETKSPFHFVVFSLIDT
jgi:hypothetical protein